MYTDAQAACLSRHNELVDLHLGFLLAGRETRRKCRAETVSLMWCSEVCRTVHKHVWCMNRVIETVLKELNWQSILAGVPDIVFFGHFVLVVGVYEASAWK